jgi:hypothetical protein
MAAVTSPMGTGPGDYLMVPDGGNGVKLVSFFATAEAAVDVSLFLGTNEDHDEIPLTGPIHMKAGIPYQFKDEEFQTSAGKGIWLIRSSNSVSVSGFVTYENVGA